MLFAGGLLTGTLQATAAEAPLGTKRVLQSLAQDGGKAPCPVGDASNPPTCASGGTGWCGYYMGTDGCTYWYAGYPGQADYQVPGSCPNSGPPPAQERACPVGDPERGYNPEGDPGDAGTVGAVTATLRSLYACLHADNPQRVMSVFSDEYLSRSLANVDTLDRETYESLEGADPAPVDRRGVLPAIGWVRLLEDGRVRAQIQGVTPELPDAGVIAFYTFVQVEDFWLIDEILVVADDAADAEDDS